MKHFIIQYIILMASIQLGYLYSFEGEGFRQDKLKVKVVDKSVKRIATLFPVQ